MPLCVNQTGSASVRRLLREQSVTVWWAAPVEISSALSRMLASGELSAGEFDRAGQRAERLGAAWIEIPPSDDLRLLARAVTRRHSLRAADALQLAAALTWCRERPAGRVFVCLDRRLSQAASTEGFQVEGL